MSSDQNIINQASQASRQKIKRKFTFFDLIFLGIPLIVSLCFYIIILRYKYATGFWPEYMIYHPGLYSEEIWSLNWFLMFPAIFGLPFALISIPFGAMLVKKMVKDKFFSKRLLVLMGIFFASGSLLTLSIITINLGFLMWLLD